jgi:hypothetical protein
MLSGGVLCTLAIFACLREAEQGLSVSRQDAKARKG